MSGQRPDDEEKLRRQLDDLEERVVANRAVIDSLVARADSANHRAAVLEARADAAQERADVSEERADAAYLRARDSEELAGDDRRRIGALENQVDVDHVMILELHDEGLISRRQAENLQEALRTSRRIGAAVGIVMANRRVSEADAFLILTKASQNTNRKVRLIADDVVATGDVSDLPSL